MLLIVPLSSELLDSRPRWRTAPGQMCLTTCTQNVLITP